MVPQPNFDPLELDLDWGSAPSNARSSTVLLPPAGTAATAGRAGPLDDTWSLEWIDDLEEPTCPDFASEATTSAGTPPTPRSPTLRAAPPPPSLAPPPYLPVTRSGVMLRPVTAVRDGVRAKGT